MERGGEGLCAAFWQLSVCGELLTKNDAGFGGTDGIHRTILMIVRLRPS